MEEEAGEGASASASKDMGAILYGGKNFLCPFFPSDSDRVMKVLLLQTATNHSVANILV